MDERCNIKCWVKFTFWWENFIKCLRRVISVDATKFDKKINKNIFPPLVTTVASLQVSEGIKYLTDDFNNLLYGKILVIDLLSNSFDTINIK